MCVFIVSFCRHGEAARTKTGFHTPMRTWRDSPASSSSQGKTHLERLSQGIFLLNSPHMLIKHGSISVSRMGGGAGPFNSSIIALGVQVPRLLFISVLFYTSAFTQCVSSTREVLLLFVQHPVWLVSDLVAWCFQN